VNTKKSNIDWYRERLQVIEDEFGLAWLKKKARKTASSGRGIHPIPRLWTRASTFIEEANATKKGEFTSEIADIFDLASDLEATRNLPGFRTAITLRHLKSLEFEKGCYVAQVASMGIRSGYAVEFIPASDKPGERTPDLLMQSPTTTLQVECKKKDQYEIDEVGKEAWPVLQECLSHLYNDIDADYEVIVCVVGSLAVRSIPGISILVANVIKQRTEGEYSGGIPDCVVLIRRGVTRPLGVEGAWIPAWQNPATATVRMSVDESGKPCYGPMLRSTLYVIDAHRMSQTLASFNSARGQLGSLGAGVIFLAVDTSRINLGDHDLYFRTLSTSIVKAFTATDNTRIAAVVITGGIAQVDITPDGGWHRTARYWTVVRNPFYPESPSILLPGEPPPLDNVMG
jgi:hypothetical protein